MKEWTTPDSQNTPSTTNLEEEGSWLTQETMAMHRCRNRSNDLIHGGKLLLLLLVVVVVVVVVVLVVVVVVLYMLGTSSSRNFR